MQNVEVISERFDGRGTNIKKKNWRKSYLPNFSFGDLEKTVLSRFALLIQLSISASLRLQVFAR